MDKEKAPDESGAISSWFAQRSWQTRPVERYGRHPDQGEDNPIRKGVAGNGRV